MVTKFPAVGDEMFLFSPLQCLVSLAKVRANSTGHFPAETHITSYQQTPPDPLIKFFFKRLTKLFYSLLSGNLSIPHLSFSALHIRPELTLCILSLWVTQKLSWSSSVHGFGFSQAQLSPALQLRDCLPPGFHHLFEGSASLPTASGCGG